MDLLEGNIFKMRGELFACVIRAFKFGDCGGKKLLLVNHNRFLGWPRHAAQTGHPVFFSIRVRQGESAKRETRAMGQCFPLELCCIRDVIFRCFFLLEAKKNCVVHVSIFDVVASAFELSFAFFVPSQ